DQTERPIGERAPRDEEQDGDDEAAAERRPEEAAREREASDRDERDDADEVGHALCDDDRSRANDGHSARLEEDERLEDLADLAGRDREDEAREEREQALALRDAADFEDREVVLPLEEAEQVIREREAARDREGAPRVRLKSRRDRPDAAIEHERAVDQ